MVRSDSVVESSKDNSKGVRFEVRIASVRSTTRMLPLAPYSILGGGGMSRFIDLTGERFGRLVVIRKIPSNRHHSQWECLCDCDAVRTVDQGNLTSGSTKSCGCFIKDVKIAQLTTHGLSRSPGGPHTRLYNIWRGMKKRCLSPSNQAYPYYGGRGITVCPEWVEYEEFHKWAMSNGYQEGLTIERKDNDGHYEPSNCIWATSKTQARNRSSNRILTYGPDSMPMSAWAEKLGMHPSALDKRLKSGWSVEKTLTTPPRRWL